MTNQHRETITFIHVRYPGVCGYFKTQFVTLYYSVTPILTAQPYTNDRSYFFVIVGTAWFTYNVTAVLRPHDGNEGSTLSTFPSIYLLTNCNTTLAPYSTLHPAHYKIILSLLTIKTNFLHFTIHRTVLFTSPNTINFLLLSNCCILPESDQKLYGGKECK